MSINETTIQAYYKAIRLMFSNKDMREGMRELDALARELVPHPVWDKLRRIDFAGELPALQAWTAQALEQHPENVAVLFFCLSDLGDQLTLFFLRQEREPAGDSDWEAYDHSVSAEVPSKVLAQMAEIAEAELIDSQGDYTNPDAGWIAETCYPLAYAGLAVAKIVQALPPSQLLGRDARRRVAVFFGEGDDFFLGEITEQGFKYYSVPDFIAG